MAIGITGPEAATKGIVIDIEESVVILQCYVAYIYSASGPNRFRSHAVAEPTALV